MVHYNNNLLLILFSFFFFSGKLIYLEERLDLHRSILNLKTFQSLVSFYKLRHLHIGKKWQLKCARIWQLLTNMFLYHIHALMQKFHILISGGSRPWAKRGFLSLALLAFLPSVIFFFTRGGGGPPPPGGPQAPPLDPPLLITLIFSSITQPLGSVFFSPQGVGCISPS